jgi:hypothetical protein
MEVISIAADNAEVFDALLARSREAGTPECGDLKLVSKAKATDRGYPGVLISFTVHYKGEPLPVQAVTTLANLLAAVKALGAKHGM